MNFTTYSAILVILGSVLGFCLASIYHLNNLGDTTSYVEERLVEIKNVCKQHYFQEVEFKRLSFPIYEFTIIEEQNETN